MQGQAPSIEPSPRSSGSRHARISSRLPYLLLPLAVWASTAGLVVAILLRAVEFGWDSLLTGLSLVALAAAAGSLWLVWLVDHERFDFALGLHSPRPMDGETVVPLVRSVLQRELGIELERAYRPGEEAPLFHGIWPGLRMFPTRIAFRSARGLTFVVQSLTEPSRGHVVNVTVLVRADDATDPLEGCEMLRRIQAEWLRAAPVPTGLMTPGPDVMSPHQPPS